MNGPILEERVNELEAQHRKLHHEVSLLERRVYLTPYEQRQMAELKKQKLLVKDELYQARRDSEPPSRCS
ncbi:MAG: YdcH family protein [Polyangiaceae bacterium]